jgi:hypothetical protein
VAVPQRRSSVTWTAIIEDSADEHLEHPARWKGQQRDVLIQSFDDVGEMAGEDAVEELAEYFLTLIQEKDITPTSEGIRFSARKVVQIYDAEDQIKMSSYIAR